MIIDTDALQGEDLTQESDGELKDSFEKLQRAGELIEAERLRRIAEIDRRRCFQGEGYLSTQSWLMDRHRVSGSSASHDVRTARSLRQMPATTEALASGEVSPGAASLLASAQEAHPEQFSSHEGSLVEAAKTLPPRELTHHVAYWRQRMDSDAALAESERQHHRRRLRVWPVASGMVRVDGELDPENGQCLITSLRAVIDAEVRSGVPEDRTSDQRRADAMGHLCRYYLDSTDRPVVGGERPHVTLIVDAEAVGGGTGRSEFTDTGPVHPKIAEQWCCDASITRVVMSADSVPLEVGASTPTVPPGHAPGRGGQGRPLRGLRPPSQLVRLPSRPPPGARGTDGHRQPGPGVPSPPPHVPPGTAQGGHEGGEAGGVQAGRDGDRAGPAVAEPKTAPAMAGFSSGPGAGHPRSWESLRLPPARRRPGRPAYRCSPACGGRSAWR
jgi:hypothetical protein